MSISEISSVTTLIVLRRAIENTGSQSRLQVSRVSIVLGESLNRSGWHERINMVSNALAGGGIVDDDSVAMDSFAMACA